MKLYALRKLTKKLFVITLASAFIAAASTPAKAALVYYAVAEDGSFCARHYNNTTGVHDFDVCWAASTGAYTFFDV